MSENYSCPNCGEKLRFNAELTYIGENVKLEDIDWYYCDHCEMNYPEDEL